MENDVLREVYGSILTSIDEGQCKFSISDVWIDEDENCIVVQHGDEEFKLTVNKA